MNGFEKLLRVNDLAQFAQTLTKHGKYEEALPVYLEAQGLLNEYVQVTLLLQTDFGNIIRALEANIAAKMTV